MKPRQCLIARCKDLGCMLTDGGDVIRVDAPQGQRLRGTGLHGVDLYTRGWTRDAAYLEIIHDLEMGLEPCDDSDCETCQDGLTFDDLLRLYPGERLA